MWEGQRVLLCLELGGTYMPELPEVETLTRAIRPFVESLQCVKCEVLRPNLRGPIPGEGLAKHLVGQNVAKVWRRSKSILWQTETGVVGIHLGMTGTLLYHENGTIKWPHTHVIFHFVDQDKGRHALHFVDPRRFGSIFVVSGHDVNAHPSLNRLGPEPLECEDLPIHLFKRSRGKQQAIKMFLMDSEHISGIGNIYACEALFASGIHPQISAGSLCIEDFKALSQAVISVLRRSIAAGGTTVRDFRTTDGKPGYFSQYLTVYGRAGKSCHVCGTVIENIRLGGRSSFFCPTCQSLLTSNGR